MSLKSGDLLLVQDYSIDGVGIASQPISIKELKNGLIGHWETDGSFSFYRSKDRIYI